MKQVNDRALKIQECGDFYRKEILPSIKLQGKWLIRAGFESSKQVLVTNPSPGVLVITVQKEEK